MGILMGIEISRISLRSHIVDHKFLKMGEIVMMMDGSLVLKHFRMFSVTVSESERGNEFERELIGLRFKLFPVAT